MRTSESPISWVFQRASSNGSLQCGHFTIGNPFDWWPVSGGYPRPVGGGRLAQDLTPTYYNTRRAPLRAPGCTGRGAGGILHVTYTGKEITHGPVDPRKHYRYPQRNEPAHPGN